MHVPDFALPPVQGACWPMLGTGQRLDIYGRLLQLAAIAGCTLGQTHIALQIIKGHTWLADRSRPD